MQFKMPTRGPPLDPEWLPGLIAFLTILSMAALCLSGCTVDEPLARVCPRSCYTGPPQTLNVGECRAGTPVCDERGNILRCEGQVFPKEERGCDYRDDDCDGDLDDSPNLLPMHPDNRCLQEGACERTWMKCVNGAYQCLYPEGFPSEELFDGLGVDEDCDGAADCDDDQAPSSRDELIFCYTGPAQTALVGECLPGFMECNPNTGRIECSDVIPRPELCNGLDDNCNGIVDDLDDDIGKVQMLFFFDTSGSMSIYFDAVTEVICDYASASPSSGIEFGLGLIATPDGQYSLALQPSSAADMCFALAQVQPYGSFEPTISAVAAVADPSNPLLVDWDDDATRVFVGFGDEPPDVRSGESLLGVFDQSVEWCKVTELQVNWFTLQEYLYLEQTTQCGGSLFPLTGHPGAMLDDLNKIIESVCVQPI